METPVISQQTKSAVPEDVKLTYCLYARKSTESDEKQALSIESQVKEMLQIAERENLDIVDIRRESHSAKDSGQRPVFKQLLEDVERERFNRILVWHPDRLSRNAGDLGSLVDLMDQKKLFTIRTYGQTFTNTPSEKFLLMILCSQAKLENDNKSINVKRGLRTRCEMGLWPAPAPTGYLNEKRVDRKGYVMIDEERAPVIKQMFEKVAYENWSGRKIYRWLKNEIKFKTTGNKFLTLSNVYVILNNHFYYGTFEYPKESGNWYQGKHEPIITKDLFDAVQNNLKERYVTRTEGKEFAFTQIMRCGLCGSGVTADEKFKKLKDGSVNRHVYYMCTKSRDISCRNKYINENDLIKEMTRILDEIHLDELGLKEKIEAELKRYNRFRTGVLKATKQKESVTEVDIRNYAKYLLQEGTIMEKRELLMHLRSRLILENKKLSLG